MEIKQVPQKRFYCVEKVLTIPEIAGFAESNANALHADAESKAMGILGPPEFIHLNCTAESDQPFLLIIALPVQAGRAAGKHFFFMETPVFYCVSMDYTGGMANIGKAWENFTQQARNAGYRFSNQSREIYKKWISFDSADNITELQLGIATRTIR